MSRIRSIWLLLAVAGVLCAACTPKKVVKKAADGDLSADADARRAGLTGSGFDDPAVDVQEASIRSKQFGDAPELKSVGFDYDMYSLDDAARSTLRGNAQYLKEHPDLEILVEGHCDERGTAEYNLALSQKRAKAVRDYYITLGVSGKAVGTLAFGEEQPLCKDATEDCWNRNRRAPTKIRSQVSMNGTPGKPSIQ